MPPDQDPRTLLAQAEEVDIDEHGRIVPKGTKGPTGVRPPQNTFYSV